MEPLPFVEAGEKPPKILPAKQLEEQVVAGVAALSDCLEEVLELDTYRNFIGELSAYFSINPDVLDHTFEWCLHKRVDIALLRRIVSQCCVYRSALRKGFYIPLWKGRPPQWHNCIISDIEHIEMYEKVFVNMHLEILSGPLVAVSTCIQQPPSIVRWLLREIGYPSRQSCHELEAVGAKLWVVLGLNDRARLIGVRYSASSSQLDYNRQLFKNRTLKHCVSVQVPCWQCPIGRADCPNGCRAVTRRQTKPEKLLNQMENKEDVKGICTQPKSGPDSNGH